MKKNYYKKTLPIKRVKLSNFKGVSQEWYSKTTPIDFAVAQENLKTLNGALVASMSPQKLDIVFEDKIKKVIPYYENDLKLIVVCANKCFLLQTENGTQTKTELAFDFEIFDSTLYKYGEESYLILATDKGLKKFSQGAVEDSEISVQFAKICNHFYRIFAVSRDSTKLEFSDDFAPFNWNQSIDEGGYINLSFDNGNITDLISFNQHLIACQTDGFTKITAYSEQEDFVIKSINSPNNIKNGSVVNCGDFIMYATNKGLGVFDGYNCKSICEGLSGFLKNCDVQAVATSEYCYYLCKNNGGDIFDNFIIAYDLAYNDYHFITCKDASSLVKVKYNGKEYVLVVEGNFLSLLSADSNGENKIWKSGLIDFASPAEYKLMKNIVFGGSTIIDLKITVDDKNYFFNISHKRSCLLNLKGKQFVFEIVPKGRNINVPSPVLEYSVLEEN